MGCSASSRHARERATVQNDDEEGDCLNCEACPGPDERLASTLCGERRRGKPCHEQAEHTTDKTEHEPADLEANAHGRGVIVGIGGRGEEGEGSVLAEGWLLLVLVGLLS